MATVQPTASSGALQTQQYIYHLQGSLLEACSCDVLCPCWIGENPDSGDCRGFLGYHYDKGEINGVDVGGLNMVMVCQIPDNVLIPHSWKVLVVMDDRASDGQVQALTDAYTGKLGGPLADLSQLVGEIIGLEKMPISHTVSGGAGEISVGDGWIAAGMEPYHGPDGSTTTLRDSIFSTIPGSPAYVAKARYHRVNIPKYGINWSFENRNAIQGDYTISYAG